jgi:hypothetical protein
MSTILPKGEKLRRALQWISERRQEEPEKSLGALVSEASLRFDLNPKQGEFLVSFYRDAERENGAE